MFYYILETICIQIFAHNYHFYCLSFLHGFLSVHLVSFPSAWKIFFSISSSASLLELNFPTFPLSENTVLIPSLLNNVLFGYSILCPYTEDINPVSSDFCCFCWKVSYGLILGPFRFTYFAPYVVARFSGFGSQRFRIIYLLFKNWYCFGSQCFLNLCFIKFINFGKVLIIIF